MNIVLVGFRCAGKSTVGQALAGALRMEFVDCDEYIERRTGLTIAEIFERCGESFFRELETDAVAELSKLDGYVVATGGGAIMRYKNVANMKRNGRVVYLKIDPGTAIRRIQTDPESKKRRPKLTGGTLEDEVQKVMEFRESYYRAAADLTVEAVDQAIQEIVATIVSGLALKPPEDEGRPAPI